MSMKIFNYNSFKNPDDIFNIVKVLYYELNC